MRLAPIYNRLMENFYHGSPIKFNAFDISKVGTGHGSAKYGHGIYFSDNQEDAAEYARKLTLRKHQDGLNIYEVRILRLNTFLRWEEELDGDIIEKVIITLKNMGKTDDAEQLREETQSYPWTTRELYEWLEYVVGGKPNASAFLVQLGVGGVIAEDSALEGNEYVVFDDSLIKILNVEKASH